MESARKNTEYRKKNRFSNFRTLNTYKFVRGIALIVCTVLLCVQPIKTTMASLNYYKAKPIIESWHANPSSISLANYKLAKQASLAAYSLHPALAFYTDTLSEVLQWGLYAGLEASVNESKTLAAKHTQQSLAIRPGWAVTWANLARTSWNENHKNANVITYLNNADTLGFNLPEVHVVWADIGFKLMEVDFVKFLTVQYNVKQHVLLGLNHPHARAALVTTIKRENKQAVVCAWLGANNNSEVRLLKMLKCRQIN